MGRLDQAQVRVVLAFLQGMYDVRGLNEFRDYVVSAIQEVVPCEVSGYAEMAPAKTSTHYRFWPPGTNDPARDRIWEHYKQEHPVLAHYVRTRDGKATKISDFLSRAEFHRLGLYNEVYRPMGVEDNLVAMLPVRSPLVVGISLHRTSRTFSERDRVVFNVLRPHVFTAYLHAKAIDDLRRDRALAASELERVGRILVFLTPKGQVRFATPDGYQRLVSYFGPAKRMKDLPEKLHRWLSESGRKSPPRELVQERGNRRLVARVVSERGERVLLLEEQLLSLPAEAGALVVLGLTERESQVLAWVGEGKSNSDIATILNTSGRTIDKHCQHIFQKLGVESRTAAARIALDTILRRKTGIHVSSVP